MSTFEQKASVALNRTALVFARAFSSEFGPAVPAEREPVRPNLFSASVTPDATEDVIEAVAMAMAETIKQKELRRIMEIQPPPLEPPYWQWTRMYHPDTGVSVVVWRESERDSFHFQVLASE